MPAKLIDEEEEVEGAEAKEIGKRCGRKEGARMRQSRVVVEKMKGTRTEVG